MCTVQLSFIYYTIEGEIIVGRNNRYCTPTWSQYKTGTSSWMCKSISLVPKKEYTNTWAVPWRLTNACLPTALARSAVGLVITYSHFYSFYRDKPRNWPFSHFDILTTSSTLLNATRRYYATVHCSTLFDATWRYSTLLNASRRYSTLFDATQRC
jgi:hypothetical protein